MSRQPSLSALADRLALAILEHGPLPCERLARLVEARTADVLAALRDDPRFQHANRGRRSTWTLVWEPWEGIGRDSPVDPRSKAALDVGERLRSLERRVAELEADSRPAR